MYGKIKTNIQMFFKHFKLINLGLFELVVVIHKSLWKNDHILTKSSKAGSDHQNFNSIGSGKIHLNKMYWGSFKDSILKELFFHNASLRLNLLYQNS